MKTLTGIFVLALLVFVVSITVFAYSFNPWLGIATGSLMTCIISYCLIQMAH